ncbi:hypothetical protein Trydic_g6109 [Trypoxylus dichotomus]
MPGRRCASRQATMTLDSIAAGFLYRREETTTTNKKKSWWPECDLHPFGYHSLKPPANHDDNIIGVTVSVQTRLPKIGQQTVHQQAPEQR